MLMLDDKYAIFVDSHNHILRKKKEDVDENKKNDDKFVNVGYYSDIRWVLHGYIKELIKEEIDNIDPSFQKFIDKLDETKKFIDSNFRGMVLEYNKKVMKKREK